MDGSTPDPTHPPSRQQTLCQIMEAGKRAPHTQTPPRSATGQVPAFHLSALPRVCRWSRWSRLYGVWVSGSCPAVSLAPVDHLTRLCDSVRPASSQVQGHPPHSSEGSWCPCLVRESLSYWRRTWWNRSLQPIWRQGFSALTSLCPRKAVGYDQSCVCASWTGPFINLLSRCSRRSASLDASVPEIGLQRSTWRTSTSMCQSFRTTGQSCGFVFEGRAYKYKVLPFGLSLSPRVFTKVVEAALFPWENRCAHSQLPRRLALTGSVSGSVVRTQGFGALAPQPVGPSGQLGKEQTLPDAEDLFSRYGVGLCQSDMRASRKNMLSRCWTAWIRSRAGWRYHWNSFRGSFGIWRLWWQSRRWGCSIWALTLAPWPSPEVGMAERHAVGPSHSSLAPNLRPVVRPFVSSGRSAPGTGLQACLWFTRMPPPRTGGPRSTGLQCRGFGRVPNCTGTSTA